MNPASSRRWRRLTAAGLLLAIVHSLGAGWCGCGDHNYWLQSARAAWSGLQGDVGGYPPLDCSLAAANEAAHVEESDCDGARAAAYLCDHGRVETCLQAALDGDSHPAIASLQTIASAGELLPSVWLREARPLLSTAPVRAHLQVFLI